MKTTIVTVHEAKADLARLLRKALQGEEVIIALSPIQGTRLVPVNIEKGERRPGSLKGQLVVNPEFFHPLSSDEAATWE